MKDTKFGGRPAIRKPKPGQRVHLSLAVPQELKGKIEKAAHERGWSISVEASHRLERSFEAEALLPQLLELKYGPKLAGLLLALARAMQIAGNISLHATPTVESSHDWLDVPAAYDQAVLAASRILEAGRLEAGSTLKKMHLIIGAKKIPFDLIAANRVFSSIHGRSTSESEMVEGAQISKLLGLSASRFKEGKK